MEATDFFGAEPAALAEADETGKPQAEGAALRRGLLWYSPQSISRLLATLAAGAAIGASAEAMQTLILTGAKARNQALQLVFASQESGLGSALGAQLFVSCCLATTAGALVLLFAPLAAGGGVAPVMAALNGHDIPGLLGLDVYCVKLIGCVLSRVAALAVGVEGPMVQLGACVASVACRAEQGYWEWWHSVRGRKGALRRDGSGADSAGSAGYESLPAGEEAEGEDGGRARNGITGQQQQQQQRWQQRELAPGRGEGDAVSTPPQQAATPAAPSPLTSPWAGGVASSLAGGGGSRGRLWEAAGDGEEGTADAPTSRAAQVDHSFWHRELVSAGVAAGIAGAFGSPLGGVLFSLEEACTHWSRSVAWRAFLCAAMASFVHSQLNPWSDMGILAAPGAATITPRQQLTQLPLLLAVSVGGGLLGASLNLLRRAVRRRLPAQRSPARCLGEALVVAALTAVTLVGVGSAVGSCRPRPEAWPAEDVIQHRCPEGQYHDLLTMFFSSSVFVVRSFFGLGSDSEPTHEGGCPSGALSTCFFTAPSLAALCLCYLFLTALTSHLVVPGGLFLPSIVIGSSFGTLCGVVALRAFPAWDVRPGVLAVVGTAAALGGVFRSALSLVAILVEGTQGVSLVLPIILGVAVSHWVAHLAGTDGAYEDDVSSSQTIAFLAQQPPKALRRLNAASVMSSPVVGLDALVPVSTVRAVLRSTSHNGFPVHTVRDPVSGLGRLDGFILRSQLTVLLRHRAYCDSEGRYLHVPPAAAAELERRLSLAMVERTRRSRSGRLLLVFDGGQGSGSGASEQPSPRLTTPQQRSANLGPLPALPAPGFPEELAEEAGVVTVGAEGEAAALTAAAAAAVAVVEGREAGRQGADSALLEAGLLAPALLAPQQAEQRVAALRTGRRVQWRSFAQRPQRRLAGEEREGKEKGAEEEGEEVDWKLGVQEEEEEEETFLNLEPFMNRAPLSVRRFTPAARVHQLFVALSLRQLCVIDRSNAVCGIVTRRDLVGAAKKEKAV